jgi:hypothetical protein
LGSAGALCGLNDGDFADVASDDDSVIADASHASAVAPPIARPRPPVVVQAPPSPVLPSEDSDDDDELPSNAAAAPSNDREEEATAATQPVPVADTGARIMATSLHVSWSQLAAQMSDEAFDAHYDVSKTAALILERGYQSVALQFPDELLPDSPRVVTRLTSFLSVQPAQWPAGARLFVLGDTSYGSEYVDEVSALHLQADFVVHFGPACAGQTQSLPVSYVFCRSSIEHEHCVGALAPFLPARPKGVLLLFDLSYHHAVPALARQLQARAAEAAAAAGADQAVQVLAGEVETFFLPVARAAAGAGAAAGSCSAASPASSSCCSAASKAAAPSAGSGAGGGGGRCCDSARVAGAAGDAQSCCASAATAGVGQAGEEGAAGATGAAGEGGAGGGGGAAKTTASDDKGGVTGICGLTVRAAVAAGSKGIFENFDAFYIGASDSSALQVGWRQWVGGSGSEAVGRRQWVRRQWVRRQWVRRQWVRRQWVRRQVGMEAVGAEAVAGERLQRGAGRAGHPLSRTRRAFARTHSLSTTHSHTSHPPPLHPPLTRRSPTAGSPLCVLRAHRQNLRLEYCCNTNCPG